MGRIQGCQTAGEDGELSEAEDWPAAVFPPECGADAV